MQLQDAIDSVIKALNFRNFQFTSVQYSTRFTAEENSKIHQLLAKSGNAIGLRDNVTFYWNDKMGKEVLACWSWQKLDLVFVTSSFRFDCKNDNFKKLAATIAHELRHRWQYSRLGLFYFLFTVPIVRNITIEIDANLITSRVNKFFNIPEGEWL